MHAFAQDHSVVVEAQIRRALLSLEEKKSRRELLRGSNGHLRKAQREVITFMQELRGILGSTPEKYNKEYRKVARFHRASKFTKR